VKTKLDQASNTMEDVARKSRTIERKLRGVEVLPEAKIQALLVAGEETEAVAVAANATEDDDPDVPF
jgi:hypothetical protein